MTRTLALFVLFAAFPIMLAIWVAGNLGPYAGFFVAYALGGAVAWALGKGEP